MTPNLQKSRTWFWNRASTTYIFRSILPFFFQNQFRGSRGTDKLHNRLKDWIYHNISYTIHYIIIFDKKKTKQPQDQLISFFCCFQPDLFAFIPWWTTIAVHTKSTPWQLIVNFSWKLCKKVSKWTLTYMGFSKYYRHFLHKSRLSCWYCILAIIQEVEVTDGMIWVLLWGHDQIYH